MDEARQCTMYGAARHQVASINVHQDTCLTQREQVDLQIDVLPVGAVRLVLQPSMSTKQDSWCLRVHRVWWHAAH